MVFQYVILFNSDRELATTIHEASSLYTINKIVDGEGYGHVYDNLRRPISKYRLKQLQAIDNKSYEFDLSKYIDFNSECNVNSSILEQFKQI